MNREQKAVVIDQVAADIESSEAVFAVDYRGISVPQAAELRTKLTEADATLQVVKNTLTERAADKAGAESLKALLEGPTALTFVRGDVAMAAKAIDTFKRANEVPSFKGGTMNGDALSVEQLEALAKLPTREVLQGQFVGVLASPLTGLVRGLGSLIGGLAVQLGAIRDQGLVTGGPGEAAPAEAEDSGQQAADSGAQAEAAPAEDSGQQAADSGAQAEAAPAEDSGAQAEAAPAENSGQQTADSGAQAEAAPADAEAAPADAEAAAAAEGEAKTEEPSEAPGDPVAEAEKAEEAETPSEGDKEG